MAIPLIDQFEHVMKARRTVYEFLNAESKIDPKKLSSIGSIKDLIFIAIQCKNFTSQHFMEELVKAILADTNEYRRLITSVANLKSLQQRFSSLTSELIELLLADDKLFDNIIVDENALRQLIALFPSSASGLIAPIIADHARFKRTITSFAIFKEMAKHNAKLMEQILSDKEAYRKLIHSSLVLMELMDEFPMYADRLMDVLFSDSDEYARLISSWPILEKMLNKFPNYSLQLIEPLMSNLAVFKSYITSLTDLRAILLKFPEYRTEILEMYTRIFDIEDTIASSEYNYPAIASALSNQEVYKQLLPYSMNLRESIQQFPFHIAALMEPILSDEEEYQRLNPSASELIALMERIPDYAETLIKPILVNPKIYKGLIASARDLALLGRGLTRLNLPSSYLEKCIEPVILDNKEYKRLITSKEDCNTVIKQYPRYALVLILGPGSSLYTPQSLKILNDISIKLDKMYNDKTLEARTLYKNSAEFYIANLDKLHTLFQLFGNKTLKFLQSLLVSSPLPIERFFSSYSLVNIEKAQFFGKFLQEKQYINLTLHEQQQLARLFSVINSALFRPLEQAALLNQLQQKTFSNVNALILFMYEKCLYSFLKDMHIDYEKVDILKAMHKLSPERFLQLLDGIKSLYGAHKRLMQEILMADLYKDQSFDHFSYSLENNTAIGTALAHHNQALIKVLELYGINPTLAFNYPKIKTFTYGSNKLASARKIWQMLESLEQMDLRGNDGRAIKKNIGNLRRQLLKTAKPITDTLSDTMMGKIFDEANINIIKKIAHNLNLLITETLSNELLKLLKINQQHLMDFLSELPPVYELALLSSIKLDNNVAKNTIYLSEEGRYVVRDPAGIVQEGQLNKTIDLSDLTKKLKNAQHKNKLKDAILQHTGKAGHTLREKKEKVKTFQVAPWNKDDIHTFFLGNDLSCCLATNGTQFPAILERRSDQGCFMHIVKNELGEPISGNWLVFVLNPETKDVYILANYFELKASYSFDPQLRDCIVSALREFTAQFAADIKAKGFIIRPLSYGNIPDFKLPPITMKIEKVGGYFNISDLSTQTTCNYYLRGIEIENFHLAPPCKPDVTLAKKEIPTVNISSHSLFKKTAVTETTPASLEQKQTNK